MAMRALPILLGLACGFWPRFGADPLESPFPIEANGNIHFTADVVWFLDDGRPSPEVEIAIPREDLSRDRLGGDSLRVEVELLDVEGEATARSSTTILRPRSEGVSEDAEDVGDCWLRLKPRWVPGTAGLRVRVLDLAATKTPLLDRLRDLHPYGEAAGRVGVPAESQEPPALSGILFVRGVLSGDGPSDNLASFRARVEPHPERAYGRSSPELTFYFEHYGPLDGEHPNLCVDYAIRRVADDVLLRQRIDTLHVAAGGSAVLKRFDIRDLPTGTYRLVVSVRLPEDDPGGPVLASSSGIFHILWNPNLASLNDGELLNHGRVLLGASQFEEFGRLDRGSREAYLRDLWQRLSPVAPGQENPLEEKFLARVREAERLYGGIPRGMMSDRGRIYVRFGPPDDVAINLNPQDEELLWRMLPGEIEDTAADEETRMRRTRRRTPQDNRAYEIWTYTTFGDPILPDYVRPGQEIGMKFIFVDEMGVGDFTLAYTSVAGGLQ